MTTLREQIIEYLQARWPRRLTSRKIAKALGAYDGSVNAICCKLVKAGVVEIAGLEKTPTGAARTYRIKRLPSARPAVGASGASTGLCVSSLFNSEGPAGSCDGAPLVTTVAVDRDEPPALIFDRRERMFAVRMNGRRYKDDPRSLAERHGRFRAMSVYVGRCGSAAAMCVDGYR